MSKQTVTLSRSRLHAGRVMFRVVTGKGDHALQLFRLHKGYTPTQAQADFPKAFSGDVDAVNRIDDNITFLGGAEARPHNPGTFVVNLAANRYLAVDQNGNGMARLRVFGTRAPQPKVPFSSHIRAFSYGFGAMPATIPHRGWTFVDNRSDQPHFVVFNHVKDNTTPKMVRRYIASGSQKPPKFGLRANTSVGVLSPNRSEVFHYHLPPGKYLLACFWPDDETGMPHFYMGMWKLIHLR
ncbi:MAG: hypothetical protein ACXVXC_15120 [Nocardioidaceae bacterium]